MPSFPRTLGVLTSGLAVAVSLSACGSATVRHDLWSPTTQRSASTAPTSTTAPDAAESQQPSTAAAPTNPAIRSGIWSFGDSVMLGAKPELAAHGVYVDAVESRQFHAGIGLVRKAAATGALPRDVVVHLGTNGSASVAECRTIVDALGPDRRVFVVNVHAPRPWMAPDNAHLRACAASYPGRRVVVVDWNRAATAHPRWFYADGIHLNGPGRTGYAAVVMATVNAYRI